MKLKYTTADGEIICMGELPNMQAGTGETVAVVEFAVPSEPLNHFTFDGNALARKDPAVINKLDTQAKFGSAAFQGDLYDAFLAGAFSDPALRLEFGALNTFAQNHDFTGMTQYINILISEGVATQADFDAVNTVTKLQNVDLTDL